MDIYITVTTKLIWIPQHPIDVFSRLHYIYFEIEDMNAKYVYIERINNDQFYSNPSSFIIRSANTFRVFMKLEFFFKTRNLFLTY